MVNVMIVEDQKLMRSILESYIKKKEGYELVSSIPGADRAADICDAGRIDLILMDVQTERRENGIAAVEKIKASHPEIKIVVVTSLVDCEVLRRAREAGADSLWYKDTDEELLMEAVRRTMAGEHIFPDAPPVVEVGTARSTEFTNAEMKVLRCLVRGMSYGAIAGALGIEVTTVKYHVSNMLQKTNLEQTPGYGMDDYCDQARGLIRKLCDAPDAGVHFFVGATQANFTVVDALLKPWQGVLCADSGHINVHETGAVEATGHKCLALPSVQGKITAQQVRDAYDAHWADASHEHIAQPGMVYISNPTEDGTLYTKEELTDLSATCYDCGLCLFVDGARMAYGLASEANDLNLQDYANLCDVFYLGGTKCGALFGEAVIINNPDLDQDFRYAIKQHGAMLAKGRLLGLQFLALLNGEDGTGSSPYYTMAAKADRQAMRIRAAFEAKGCAMLFDSPTNQQFPILPNSWYNALSEKYAMTLTAKPDAEHTAVRFCTSWATRDEDVDALLADIASL